MKISGRQLAAARSLLNWSQQHLATAAGVTQQTIALWETEQQVPRASTLARVMAVIEERGVEFTNGGAPGVRFKPKPNASAENESAGK